MTNNCKLTWLHSIPATPDWSIVTHRCVISNIICEFSSVRCGSSEVAVLQNLLISSPSQSKMLFFVALVLLQVSFVVVESSAPLSFECPQISCPSGKFGDCKTFRGCKLCKCAPLCPPTIPCPPDCETIKKDGCPIDCKCKPKTDLPAICPLGPLCGLHCKNGYEVDENGCVNSCKCKEPKREAPCSDEPLCFKFCKFGYRRDSRGCMTCNCKPFIPAGLRPDEAGAPGTK